MMPEEIFKLPLTEVVKRLLDVIREKDKTLQSLDQSLAFVYKVVTHERTRLGPAGLDGHLNSIGGTVIQMRQWIKESKPSRALTHLEQAKGRSEGYWEMSSKDQWAEDKRLGILDWDGK